MKYYIERNQQNWTVLFNFQDIIHIMSYGIEINPPIYSQYKSIFYPCLHIKGVSSKNWNVKLKEIE